MRIKDARQTFLGIWIRNLIEKKPITIFGNGKQIRDYNYVDDVVDALLLAVSNNKSYGNIYNLGNSNPISLKETAKIMIGQNGNGQYIFKPFPKDLKSIDIGDYYSDFNKIKKDLGWQPKVSFDIGMLKTIQYFKNNFEKYIDDSVQ